MSISKLGDMIAIISIPLFLYEMSNDLTQSAGFSIIVTVASMLVSKPAAKALKYFSVLQITFWADLMVCFLLAGLIFYVSYYAFDLIVFLSLCGLIGLVINFPLYIKNNLLHKVFISEKDTPRFSSMQGTIYSLTFAIAILISGVIYEYLGFAGVLVVDIITYIPLLIFLKLHASEEAEASEKKIENLENSSQELVKTEQNFELSYYIANAGTFFFSTLRSHILFTLLVAMYGGLAGKPEIAFWVLLGAALNLATNTIMEQLRVYLSNYLLVLSFLWLCLLGLVLHLKVDFWAVCILMSFSFTELVGLCLRQMRLYQRDLSCGGSSEKVAFRAYLIATIVSSVSLPSFLFSYEHIGQLLTFVLFGFLFFLVPFIINGNFLKKEKFRNSVIICCLCLVVFGFARAVSA